MKVPVFIVAAAIISHAVEAQEAYVQVEVANVRAGPSTDYSVENRIYVGQKVEIHERQNGWARITAPQYSPRWISESLLGASKPDTAEGFVLPAELRRNDLSALSDKPIGNLSGADVVALRRFAAHLIDSGQCRTIEDGDESVNRPGQLFVFCENSRREYANKTEWSD